MRLRLKISPSTNPVDFDYPHKLCGVINKWLGVNNLLHNKLSLYSYSGLSNSKFHKENNKLNFPNGSTWDISFWEHENVLKLKENINNCPELFCGMEVVGFEEVEPPRFNHHTIYKVSSPILLKHRVSSDEVKHIVYTDGELANEILNKSIQSKLTEAGMEDFISEFEAKFLLNCPSSKTKLINIKGILNKVSCCPIMIEGPYEVQYFCWLTGVGYSTGVGFGSLI